MMSAGARIRADDLLEYRAQLDEVGRVLGHEALARLCIDEDAAERLAQLVRERTRKRTHGGNARKVRQLLPLKLRHRAGFLLLRNVDRDAEYSRKRGAFGGVRGAAASGDPAHRAIGKNDAEFGLIIAAIRDRALDGVLAQCAVVRMDASTQRGVIDGRVRLETEESFVLYPDRVTLPDPIPTAPVARSPRRGSSALR
jgi:hypothetical protein